MAEQEQAKQKTEPGQQAVTEELTDDQLDNVTGGAGNTGQGTLVSPTGLADLLGGGSKDAKTV